MPRPPMIPPTDKTPEELADLILRVPPNERPEVSTEPEPTPDDVDDVDDDAELRRPKLIYTGGPAHRSLEHAMLIVDQAFDERTYLVGSALKTPEFRDVDCRMIMSDAKFEELFGTGPTSLNALHSLLSVAISEYLSTRSGLPVDFQIQKRSEVTNADWDKMRIPLGVFFANEEMKPPWMLKPNI